MNEEEFEIVELSDQDFSNTILSGVTFIEFYADWCGPCKISSPIVQELTEEFKNKATIVRVNVDKYQEISINNGVKAVPTFVIYKNGEIVDTIINIKTKAEFSDKINSYIN